MSDRLFLFCRDCAGESAVVMPNCALKALLTASSVRRRQVHVEVVRGRAGEQAAPFLPRVRFLTVSPNDTLHIQSATWSRSSQILKVTATSTNPQAILTLFLASGNVNLRAFANLAAALQLPGLVHDRNPRQRERKK
jgi:hypothetical protein